MLMLPASVEVIDGLVAAADAAPEELSMIANIMKAPPMPFIPAEAHGKPIVIALMVYAGDAEPGRAGDRADPRARDAARRPGPPDPLPADVRGAGGPAAGGLRGDERARRFPRARGGGGDPRASRDLQRPDGGGPAPRARRGDGARSRRCDRVRASRREDDGELAAMYGNPAEGPEHEAWASGLATALSDGTAAAYVGFLGDDGDEGVRRAYPPATLKRLADVKRQYDPDNLFRLNLNVTPAAE